MLARNMCVEGMAVAFGDFQTRVARTVRSDQEIQDSHCCPGEYDALFRVVMAYDS